MSNTTNTTAIINACDSIIRKVTTIGGTRHGSSWLCDQVMRAFEFAPTEAVTYSVHINYPVNKDGEVTIHRNGQYELRIV